jgi:hypothetical protein
MNMRHFFTLSLLTLLAIESASGGDGSVRFRYDSEHRHREFYQSIRILPPPDYSNYVDPRLLVRSEEIIKTGIHELPSGQAQISLDFIASNSETVRIFIEANRSKNMRVEIGDYVLPVDLERTFPWQGKVWLEARPTSKANVILNSFKRNES